MNKFREKILTSKTCSVCPRNCNVDRISKLGFCKAHNTIKIAKIMIHEWEEPYLTNIENKNNKNEPFGSGAIFFSNCNLKCIFCQNHEISTCDNGKEISTEKLIEIFKFFESKNVCNINLVTPTHYVKQIIEALLIYKPKIPVIYNTSGYETVETIKALNGLIDIYLFDFKYTKNDTAKEYSNAFNYPEICKNALLEAKKQIKTDIFENGIMKKGIIVRHLLLPGESQMGVDVLNFINENLGKNSYVSLLSQYVPMGKALSHPVLKNRPKKLEYKRLIEKAKALNMQNVYLQDFESSSCVFVPDFKIFSDIK